MSNDSQTIQFPDQFKRPCALLHDSTSRLFVEPIVIASAPTDGLQIRQIMVTHTRQSRQEFSSFKLPAAINVQVLVITPSPHDRDPRGTRWSSGSRVPAGSLDTATRQPWLTLISLNALKSFHRYVHKLSGNFE